MTRVETQGLCPRCKGPLDGGQGYCPPCRREYQREWCAIDPPARVELWRKARLKKYGLTLEQYDEMLIAQDGGCAICGESESSGKSLSVDHDHKTGQVRELLCRKCNSTLGYMREDPQLLMAAATYLMKHSRESQIT